MTLKSKDRGSPQIMGWRRAATACHCARSLSIFSSTLLFLSFVLPTSTFSQVTSTAEAPTTFSPITFQTSPSSSSSPTSPSSAAASTTADPDEVQDHVFNYYFLIIAVVAVLFCLGLLYVGRRKKRKAALLRSQSQRALATDVAGFRARFGNRPRRTGGGSYGGGRPRLGRVEGLDERGEAPPPYVPGKKPPSIGSAEELPTTTRPATHSVELEELTIPQSVHQPPSYGQNIRGGGSSVGGLDAGEIVNERSGTG